MTTGRSDETPAPPAAVIRQPRWYEGKIWWGMDLFGWLRLLLRNRLAISPARIPAAATITALATSNTALRWLQRGVYGRRVARVPVPDNPVFILGHWRSGTTMLHELFALDPRFRCPTTFECLSPNHFLLTERLVRRWLRFVMPRKRPMDNMRMGYDLPQEDETGLCNLGLPSPFLSIAFPNRPPQHPDHVDLERLSPRRLRRWQRGLQRFLQTMLYKRPGRLVLKSPQHTFRLRVLTKMFPEARFVLIVRDPYVVYSSSVHYWSVFQTQQGLQRPDLSQVPELVLSTYDAMHRKFEETRDLIPPGRLMTIRFEDLTADPVERMRDLYRQLELGDFEPAAPAVAHYARRVKKYRANQYELDEASRDVIRRRWGPHIRRYGYESQ